MEDETLIQRFLDGELRRDEKRALLRALESREGLRARLLADEVMLEAAASLPRAEVPEEFVSRVASSLPAVDRPVVRRAPWLRHAVLAAAAGVLLALGFWAGRAGAPAPPPMADASGQEVLVRLVLLDPRARTVTVAGDFNDWDPRRTPLQRGEGGVFHVTLPLRPGRYQYLYVVDGKEWVVDPLAEENTLDGFGAQNSVLDVEI
jgi:AMP-activated protein kinase-like protein